MQRLLILHGWGSNAGRWQKVKEILEKEGIEVLIPNLPGFGFTPPPKEPWGIDDYVNWVLDFLKEKEWTRFNLLGHSFGGGLATRIVETKPEMVEKLILCAAAVIRDEKSKKTLFFYSLGKVGKKIFSLPGLRKFYPAAANALYTLNNSKDYYLAEGVMKDTFKRVTSQDLKISLEKITAPTLILWGSKDDMVPEKDAHILHEKIKNSKLVIFPGIGHNLNTQIPEKIANETLKFLKK